MVHICSANAGVRASRITEHLKVQLPTALWRPALAGHVEDTWLLRDEFHWCPHVQLGTWKTRGFCVMNSTGVRTFKRTSLVRATLAFQAHV